MWRRFRRGSCRRNKGATHANRYHGTVWLYRKVSISRSSGYPRVLSCDPSARKEKDTEGKAGRGSLDANQDQKASSALEVTRYSNVIAIYIYIYTVDLTRTSEPSIAKHRAPFLLTAASRPFSSLMLYSTESSHTHWALEYYAIIYTTRALEFCRLWHQVWNHSTVRVFPFSTWYIARMHANVTRISDIYLFYLFFMFFFFHSCVNIHWCILVILNKIFI